MCISSPVYIYIYIYIYIMYVFLLHPTGFLKRISPLEVLEKLKAGYAVRF